MRHKASSPRTQWSGQSSITTAAATFAGSVLLDSATSAYVSCVTDSLSQIGLDLDNPHIGSSTNARISFTPTITRHTSHVTRHKSHATRHTSHVTIHTSHVTRHTSPFSSDWPLQNAFLAARARTGSYLRGFVLVVINVMVGSFLVWLQFKLDHCRRRVRVTVVGRRRKQQQQQQQQLCFDRCIQLEFIFASVYHW